MTSQLPPQSTKRSRNTHRKSLIREAFESTYARRAVVLDELRWAVRVAELEGGNVTGATITRSWMNSFARTLREQFPEYAIRKVPIDGTTPVGLVARTALYRLKNLDDLQQFLRAEEPCILCRYRTNVDVEEPRYQWRYVTPQFHVAAFRFFAERPKTLTYVELENIPGTLKPCTHKLSLVVPPGVEVDMRSVASVPWNLFAYKELSDWHEVDPMDGLASVERNRGDGTRRI